MQSTANGIQQTPHESDIPGDIPLDVLEVIFKSLLPHDLAMCCRVNKAVNSLAFDALYRDLRPNRRNVLRLCLKLCNEPNLARRVRSFVIRDNSVDMYLGIISDALPQLPRLHTLILCIGPSSSWILPHGESCPFLLHTFVCAFLYDAPLASFLDGQRDLKHFTVSGPIPPRLLRAVSPQLVPNLVSICAPLSVVEALVPGRPLRDITTFSNPGTNAPSISCLSRSASRTGIQRLMLNFSYLQYVGCELLAQATPNLAKLTIDADGVKPDDEEVLDELTEWIEEYLSYAKNLDSLSIRFFPVLSRVPCQELDFCDMITSIFAASTKLRHVIITFYAYKAKYVCKKIPGHDWFIVND
ncbi:hypothetical protein BDZ97DRAFT_567870 [Flammula alnicola]|nr:hypothetical protein BDZ97DRAFT_567870 [Flammula alnicola]